MKKLLKELSCLKIEMTQQLKALSTMIQQLKSKKQFIHDYFNHLERFGFKWEEVQLQFKYSVKLSNDKKN